MVSVAASYHQAKPTVLPFPMLGFDPDYTTPSSDIEFQFDEGLLALPHFVVPQRKRSKHLFEDLASDVATEIQLIRKYEQQQPSIEGITEGSLEDLFVKSHNLFEAIQLAQELISSMCVDSPQLSFEYCRDADDDSFEWLDINLHYQTANDDEIEALLDRLDHLNDEFSAQVDPAKELLINFHLDIV